MRAWNAFKVLPTLFRAWRGNVGLFLLCWVYLREVQQQDRTCVCRGEREEAEQEAQPAQSISWKIYLMPPWSGLPSAEQIKLHLPLAGTSSPMPMWLQTSTSVSELIPLTLKVVYSLTFPFQHRYCQQKAVSRLQSKRKRPRSCVLTDDVCTPWEKASLQKLSISAPASTSVALLLATAMSFKHFFPVPLKRKK